MLVTTMVKDDSQPSKCATMTLLSDLRWPSQLCTGCSIPNPPSHASIVAIAFGIASLICSVCDAICELTIQTVPPTTPTIRMSAIATAMVSGRRRCFLNGSAIARMIVAMRTAPKRSTSTNRNFQRRNAPAAIAATINVRRMNSWVSIAFPFGIRRLTRRTHSRSGRESDQSCGQPSMISTKRVSQAFVW